MSSSLLDIRGIPPEWSQSHVRGLVENIAAVSSVTMQPGPRGGQIAQVRLESTEAAPTCVRQLNGQQAPGHTEWKLNVQVGHGELPQAPQQDAKPPAAPKGGGKGDSMGKGKGKGDWGGGKGGDMMDGGGKGKGKKGKKDLMNPLYDRGPKGCAMNLPKALQSLDCIAGQAGYTGIEFTERDPAQVVSIKKPIPNYQQWGGAAGGWGAKGGFGPPGGQEPWTGKGRGAKGGGGGGGHWINTPCPFCSGDVQVEYTPGQGDQYECAHCGGLFALE
eukprot:Hpha_TRINITY_DN16263_c4_g2::TRINITY_DN16263_c4_g2_i4::g.15642::m.15642